MLANYNEILTVNEVADILHVCDASVYTLIKEGRLLSFKDGRKTLIYKDELLYFLYRS